VDSGAPARRDLLGVALVSATLLMTELALTRIFSVVMYYHFAFLAISIALFGLSASGVTAYVLRARLDRHPTSTLLARHSIVYGVATIVSLFVLVRLRVGLNYSPRNLQLMLTIYALAALPFFTGGLVLTLAVSRFVSRVNAVYAADLLGAACGCLVLIPLLDRLGAPGVVLTAAALSFGAAVLFAPAAARRSVAGMGAAALALALGIQLSGLASFDVTDTKGHQGDRVLFSKWNSFSRIGVYARAHGDWSLSPAYHGPLPDTLFMDIDSAASTPILHAAPDLANVEYLRYELTALVYWIVAGDRGLTAHQPPAAGAAPSAASGFSALVIGPGGGRDLASALVFGARHVDGVEINPIIADEVMRGQFLDFSGRLYTHSRVRIVVDDGRSFVRRTPDKYDVIQASLVDTWAATAAGAYTLTENTLYTVEAFEDYLDHLKDNGVLSVTRWMFDGLRLVSLAQEACARRGCDPATRLALVRHDKVMTFLFKKSPFTEAEIAQLAAVARDLQFEILYAPSLPDPENDYARLIEAPDRERFYSSYGQDIRPTTDDRPFFFHTTKLGDQFQVAFGRSMLFGNGLSALVTLMAISGALVLLFVIGPLILAGGAPSRRWLSWLVYFGALGAGFMLIEVSLLQHFVLLLGHPVYSLTVTLFSLLVGTGIGAAWSRRFDQESLRRVAMLALLVAAAVGVLAIVALTPIVAWAMPLPRSARMIVAVATLVPIGMTLGIPMPAGLRLLSARAPQMVTWAWGMNGALSVVGATLAIFIAMNWGFSATLLAASLTYIFALIAIATTS
jgi:hypothetical protein